MIPAELYELRAKLRPMAVSRRVADCGLRPVGDPALVVQDTDAGRCAFWRGLLQCGRQHSCPICAARRAATRADELNRLMAGDPGGRWQMVTLTVRHNASESLRTVLDRLVGAYRRVRSLRGVREIYDEHVTASVRAIEVTYGKNGWHPHIHLLLRTTEWTNAQRDVFERAWLGKGSSASGTFGVVWSDALGWTEGRARYLSKLSAEVAGIGKQPRNGNETPWQIAERALSDPKAKQLWTEFQSTMAGRRILELDERAKALVAPPAEPKPITQEWIFGVFAEEFRAIARLERRFPTFLHELIETAIAAGPDPPRVLRAALDDMLEWSEPSKRAVRGEAFEVLESHTRAA